MNRFVIGVGATAMAAAAIWFAAQSRSDASAGANTGAAAPAQHRRNLSAAAVLAIDPRATPAPAGPARASGASPLEREFSAARNLRTLHERLRTLAHPGAEEAYYLYRIARACATVTDAAMPAMPTRAERRLAFIAGLTESDPYRAQRIAAFDAANADRCEGIAQFSLVVADLDRMLADAAQAGDPKARAALVERQVMEELRRRSGAGAGGAPLRFAAPALSDAQIDSLREAIGSGDPEAMRTAGRLFSNSLDELSIRVGPNGEDIDQGAFYGAWRLLACDYGAPCDASSADLLSGCAYEGRCGVNNFADYLYYYGSTPYESQLLDRYRGMLAHTVETGDWSQIRFVRGPTSGRNRYFFAGG